MKIKIFAQKSFSPKIESDQSLEMDNRLERIRNLNLEIDKKIKNDENLDIGRKFKINQVLKIPGPNFLP